MTSLIQYNALFRCGGALKFAHQQECNMKRNEMTLETCLTTQQVADALGVCTETARLMLKNEPDVLKLKGRGTGRRKHYRTPLSVLNRLKRRMGA
jgi:hypothetical protein